MAEDPDAPCSCPVGEELPHTNAQHDEGDCGGWTWDPPCGGCYRCLNMQKAHYEALARREATT